ncbi:membrane protein [Hydrogenimonas sp.]|nr:membrane protein [Hydrogenimonas sp.]
MIKTLFTQTNWSLLGTVYGFAIGFFVKMFLVNKVGATDFGLYTIGQGFQGAIATLIAFSLPTVIIKFLPKYINRDDKEAATILCTKSLLFLLSVSLVAVISMITANSLIAKYIFHKENLDTIIAISSLYIPLTLYSMYITSVYRSFLKIKEIILYGTLYLVTIRALLTFAVFSYSDEIIYFLWIEIVAQIVSIVLLTARFKSDKLKLFDPSSIKKPLSEKESILSFAKTIYSNSLVGFVGGYTMTFIMSILLPAKLIGIFAILMTIAGLTNFLQSNINKVFAPIISTLVSKEEFDQLSLLYKESTFVLNIMTIPFILAVVLFSKDILGLYGHEFSNYTFELMILFLANYYSLMVGSSGMIMMMGGLEKEELKIQIYQLLFTLISSLIFLPLYGVLAAVFIRFASMFMINQTEVYYIYKRFAIWPWDRYSYILMGMFLVSLFIVFKYHTNTFAIWEYLLYPILFYAIFFAIFYKKLIEVYRLVKAGG